MTDISFKDVLSAQRIMNKQEIPTKGRKMVLTIGQYTNLCSSEGFVPDDYIMELFKDNDYLMFPLEEA